MKNISIFGTSSDAGKSTLSWVIGRLLQERGYLVAPFKAQNVSNNAHIADDNSEISIAQHFQAKALGVQTSWHNNPVLLKSGRGSSASLIIKGKALATKDVREYYKDLDMLKPVVDEAFEYLDKHYDIVIAEGAGSPVELNLMDKDLSNIYIASKFNTKIILVADIEKGGVFASIYGVYHLLPPQLRDNVIGVIVNKFRGDMSLFDEGVRIIEQEFGIKVLGVVPYTPFNLGFEDSQSLKNYTQECNQAKEKIAVIAYPTMSNYNDFEPLLADDNKCVEFVTSNINLSNYDTIILPGSKLLAKDLKWLKQNGLFAQIQHLAKDTDISIVGICGGFEMLHNYIIDSDAIESTKPIKEEGLKLIDANIVFQKEKILKKSSHTYEIHHGVSTKYNNDYQQGNIYGTFRHGLFVDEKFLEYEQNKIQEFVSTLKPYLDIDRIVECIS